MCSGCVQEPELIESKASENKKPAFIQQVTIYMVEMMGFEPTTCALRTHRSPNWATSPQVFILIEIPSISTLIFLEPKNPQDIYLIDNNMQSIRGGK